MTPTGKPRIDGGQMRTAGPGGDRGDSHQRSRRRTGGVPQMTRVQDRLAPVPEDSDASETSCTWTGMAFPGRPS